MYRVKNNLMKKYYKKTKKIIVLLMMIFFVMSDLILGLIFYVNPGLSSTDNHIVFRKLINIYIFAVNKYDNQNSNEKNKYYRYIPNWDSIFKRDARKFPACWYDYNYIMPAPSSVNFIRKILYKRKGEYLIFDLNKASDKIRNDPYTIIIAEPFPQRGKRRVFRVKDIKTGRYDKISENLIQNQFKKQNWSPAVITEYSNSIPSECEDDSLSAKKILLKNFRIKVPAKALVSKRQSDL
jgi:hypothetical protein